MAHLSYRAGTEGKHNKKNINKASAHTYRKTEQKYKSHGNEKIDMDRTKYNNDWTITGESISKIVEDRIDKVFAGKKSPRKDAVLIREIIVQASPEIYEGLTQDEKLDTSEKFTKDTYEFLCDEFGKDNVIGYSEHHDETNPHTHFSIMPLTSDGRLSQKDFFKGPSGLKRQHRLYREHMNNSGWEFDTENKFEEQESVPLAKFKKNAAAIVAKRAENQRLLDELKDDPNLHDVAIETLMDELEDDVRMQQLKEKEKELDDERKALIEQWEKIDSEKRQNAKERAELADERDRVTYLTGFTEAVVTNEPKIHTRVEVHRMLQEATNGRFGVLVNNKTKETVLGVNKGLNSEGKTRWGVTDVATIAGAEYGMKKGKDITIDPAYEQTQSLSYALGKFKYIDKPVPDNVAVSEGYQTIVEGARQKQMEYEKDLSK